MGGRVTDVCFGEEALGDVGAQARLIHEQLCGCYMSNSEISFCVQRVCLSLWAVWCLLFKGA